MLAQSHGTLGEDSTSLLYDQALLMDGMTCNRPEFVRASEPRPNRSI